MHRLMHACKPALAALRCCLPAASCACRFSGLSQPCCAVLAACRHWRRVDALLLQPIFGGSKSRAAPSRLNLMDLA